MAGQLVRLAAAASLGLCANPGICADQAAVSPERVTQPNARWERIASFLKASPSEEQSIGAQNSAGLKRDDGGHFLLLGVIFDLQSDVRRPCRFRIITATIGC
jgi:hypothetical protein